MLTLSHVNRLWELNRFFQDWSIVKIWLRRRCEENWQKRCVYPKELIPWKKWPSLWQYPNNETTWCCCEPTCLSLQSLFWPWPVWPLTLTHMTLDLDTCDLWPNLVTLGQMVPVVPRYEYFSSNFGLVTDRNWRIWPGLASHPLQRQCFFI